MKLLSILIVIAMMSGCGLYQRYSTHQNTVFKGTIYTNHVIVMQNYQLEVPKLRGYTSWNRYQDEREPEKIIMVTGMSYDEYDNHYSTYALKIETHKTDHVINTLVTANKYLKNEMDWRSDISKIPNDNGEFCVGSIGNHPNLADDMLYIYYAACFSSTSKEFVLLEASEIKRKSGPNKEFGDFILELFKSYKSL